MREAVAELEENEIKTINSTERVGQPNSQPNNKYMMHLDANRQKTSVNLIQGNLTANNQSKS